MDSYRKNYETLPDTESLTNVRMDNGSEAIDYEKRTKHVAASQAFLKARSKRLAERMAQRAVKE